MLALGVAVNGSALEPVVALDGRDVNLRLYQRWLDVRDRVPEYAAGAGRLDGVLAELQELYLTRLDYALRAVYALQHREPGDGPRSEAMSEAVAVVRELDAAHLRRVNEARLEFFDPLDEAALLARFEKLMTGSRL